MQVHSNNTDISVVVPLDLTDEAVNEFTTRLNELIAKSPREINLDCGRLKWVVSKHVNLLWQAHNQCQESGVQARLINTSDKLIRVLKLLDIYDLLVCDPADVTVKLDLHNLQAIPSEADIKNSWQIVFRPDVTDIKVALDRLRNYLATLNVSDLFTFEVETVFYEIATNVRLHSGISDEERVFVRCVPSSDQLRMEFEYRGVHFDPADIDREFDINGAARKGQKHGYGLLMINRMTDGIKYAHADDGRNTLTLEKRWR